jgi:hypothetical protein
MDKLTFNPITGSANVEIANDGQFTYLRYKHDTNLGPSASKKSLGVASTKGNVKVGEVSIGLNVYRKNPEYVKA